MSKTGKAIKEQLISPVLHAKFSFLSRIDFFSLHFDFLRDEQTNLSWNCIIRSRSLFHFFYCPPSSFKFILHSSAVLLQPSSSSTDFHRLPQASSQPLQAYTSLYKPLQASTGLHRPSQAFSSSSRRSEAFHSARSNAHKTLDATQATSHLKFCSPCNANRRAWRARK